MQTKLFVNAHSLCDVKDRSFYWLDRDSGLGALEFEIDKGSLEEAISMGVKFGARTVLFNSRRYVKFISRLSADRRRITDVSFSGDLTKSTKEELNEALLSANEGDFADLINLIIRLDSESNVFVKSVTWKNDRGSRTLSLFNSGIFFASDKSDVQKSGRIIAGALN